MPSVRLISLLLVLAFAVPLFGDCPKSDQEWQAWQIKRTEELFRKRFSDEVFSASRRELDACDPKARGSVRAHYCLSNLRTFIKAITQADVANHSMGFKITDAEYFAQAPFKEMLELPAALSDPAFMKLLDDDSNPQFIEAALKKIDEINRKIPEPENKWIAFPYRSQHLPTADDTGALGRFFVYVPGKNFDQFLQFGIRHEPNLEKTYSASIVAVQKKTPGGRDLRYPLSWLNDLWRVRDEETNEVLSMSTRLEQSGNLENCYQCHKNAILPITPAPFPATIVVPTYWKRFKEDIQKVNQQMDSYRSLRQAFLNQKSHGPPLGPKGARTLPFLKSCAGAKVKSEEALQRIGSEMQCARCHNGKRRGMLNFPSGLRLQKVSGNSLVKDYVAVHREMPPDASLNDPEREALVDCLYKE